MSDFWRDPELNQLVREINRTEVAPGDPQRIRRLASPGMPAEQTATLQMLLDQMLSRAASDLLLIPGRPPVLRIHGELMSLGAESIDQVGPIFGPYLHDARVDQLESLGAVDFSIRSENQGQSRRFRVNVHRQRGDLAAAVRALPAGIPTLEDLKLPATLARLVEPTAGLVLVCGPAGAGKSSTMAALLGEINRRFARHVISIEDPIEYEHANDKAVIEQLEIGTDTPSFAAALRASLRQDPDVILVGEMRDLETVATALTAAETGHLILSTLHTSDASQAIHRIIDVFPASQQGRIRHQLALSLNATVSQQLIPRADRSGRAVAVEVLLANDAVRNHIRGEKLQNLPSEITLGKRSGMISFEESLANLVREETISPEEARIRSRRPDELESFLRKS